MNATPAKKATSAKKASAPKVKYGTLDLAQYSLQFSDSEKQHRHDAVELFSHNYHAITGTESGEEDTRRQMRLAARAAGYTFMVNRSNWVAIRRNLIKTKTYFKGSKVFVDNDLVKGKGHDLHVTWAGCEMEGFGHVTFLASHFSTHGRPVRNPEYNVNLRWNKILAKGVGDLAEHFGKGKAIVFYGGDQNIVDRTTDTFFGEDLTSAWDELGKWENTGHGNIDVIASYDHDGRVEAKYIRALDDKEQYMNSDHYPVEAGFKVRLLS